jgi:hypothetical protein
VLALGGSHLLAPRLRSLPSVPEAVVGSVAGGIAVAYVFLHLLPELAEGNEVVGEALGDPTEATPLLDLGIFLVALAGFLAFYGLERLGRARGDRAAGGGSDLVFRVHLGAYALHGALIAYTMPLRVRTGAEFAVLFTIAIGLHFVLTDRGMSEHYPRRFDRRARLGLAAALLAGWVAVALAAPSRTAIVSVMNALIAGSVLVNVFKEELPDPERSRFAWFAAATLFYAALLTAATALSD